MGEEMSKRVYVAGCYSADNVLDILKNIGRGEDYSAEIFLRGLFPFCPWHDKDYIIRFWDADYTVQQFYDYSIAFLRVCDAIFLVPGWEDSKGAWKELQIAGEMGIPVFEEID